MRFCRNKKSLVKETIIGLLILIVGFLLILSILKMFSSQAEAKTAEAICKGSVVLREKTYTEIGVGSVEFTSVSSPLLCKTIDKRLPENKDAAKEQVKRDFANLMASCWNQFGEGLITDVFKGGSPFTNNCFVCYNINLRATSKFRSGENIQSAELLQYLFEQPYKVSEKSDNCKFNGGFCVNSESKESCPIKADVSYINIDKKSPICRKNGKTSCCYTDYECWNRGGICSGNDLGNEYLRYNKWNCPKDMECFVKKENYLSYGQYVQKYGGEGKIVIASDITPEEIYAISFGSPTDKCDVCGRMGLGGGIGAGAATFIAITIAVGSGPIGWTIAGVGAAGTGLLTYIGIKEVAQLSAVTIKELFNERQFPTIYLSTLNQIQDGKLCSIVQD